MSKFIDELNLHEVVGIHENIKLKQSMKKYMMYSVEII